ncbi:MAG: hypothetical protein HXY45_00175 [Syntrophaceae bacterium]|jgi:hypothetical protein|nr:hypothetical protein [Syntrophaceae bacterium]
MEKVKIVCRYLNGKIIKGFTQDFSPTKPSFHVFPTQTGNPNESLTVYLRELKAIFFVRDFMGRPDYDERKHYDPNEHPSGRIVEVTFTDGETLVGSTLGYDPKRPGFFIFPADPQSNNARVFALSKAVRLVRYL